MLVMTRRFEFCSDAQLVVRASWIPCTLCPGGSRGVLCSSDLNYPGVRRHKDHWKVQMSAKRSPDLLTKWSLFLDSFNTICYSHFVSSSI